MRYRRKHEIVLYALGLSGFLGLLLAGAYYPPGAVWLRGAALVWFIGLGLVRCLALLTMGQGAGTSAPKWSGSSRGMGSGEEAKGSTPPPAGPGRPWD